MWAFAVQTASVLHKQFEPCLQDHHPYSKSSLTLALNEWRFNLSFPWVSMLFFNRWRVSNHIVRYGTNPPAIQKQKWHLKKAPIEPPLIECECEWAFRIRAQEWQLDKPENELSCWTKYASRNVQFWQARSSSKGVLSIQIVLCSNSKD
jgi:hypothetical protein